MLLSALTACRTQNGVFDFRPQPERPGEFALFYDRYGALYPDSTVVLTRSDLAANQMYLDSVFIKARTATLAADHTRWTRLVAQTGVLDTGSADKVFAAAQDSLGARAARTINSLTHPHGASTRPLVVLIHGFRNDYEGATSWYLAARDLVRQRPGMEQAVMLYVHWDGLTGNPVSIWGKALYNYPNVGLEFRRIISAVAPDVPIRVLTHSSGAGVISTVFGDVGYALPSTRDVTVTDFATYRAEVNARKGAYARHFPRDVRVAMVVPAMDPVAFTDFPRDSAGPTRWIFGLNPRDYAVTKLFNCNWGLSTCLATKFKPYCDTLRQQLGPARGAKTYVFDFSHSKASRDKWWLFWEDHSMTTYLKRDDMIQLLDLLLTDQAVADEGLEVCGPA